MILTNFHKFLINLGYSEIELSGQQENIFTYSIDDKPQLDITYFYTPDKIDIFKTHRDLWNENKVETFITVCDTTTHLISAKVKPNHEKPLIGEIKSFNYGINTHGFKKEKVREITKEYIDASYFFDFIIKNRKKGNEVDKDLLLNLIALHNKLLEKNNHEIIHRLILRCIFVKYLEDRKIFSENYLTKTLQTGQPIELINVFNEVAKINGDIFKYESLTESDIKSSYLSELFRFFNSDYLTGQLSLFPYLFDKIPIQLISHVYEAFLQNDEKKGKGIYYTPAFVVNFILEHSLKQKLKNSQSITVLDPAVGSGAFLVESFKAIINSYNYRIGYEKKKEILQNQLFGIDIDSKALQIAAFSLYLALLETEEPDFIRKQIEDSSPILPPLIGSNLIHANAITDNVFDNKHFDCIVSNPPWGSAVPNDDNENRKERKAIGTKGKKGTMPEYRNVSDYERSQAFLIRVKKWSKAETIFTLIVKNSIFLNDNSQDFRSELLKIYHLSYFYELSNYNKILFKKHVIGKINGKDVEVGATEPCAILVFENIKKENNFITYISPKLNGFTENLKLIHYTQKDKIEVEQKYFTKDDLLWRVLVKGDFEVYKLIKKTLLNKKEASIECRAGFKATSSMKPLGEPDFRKLIEPNDFTRYKIIKKLNTFNYNQEMERRRSEKIFEGERLLFPNRPLKQDEYKLRCIRVTSNEIHKDNISSIRINNKVNNNLLLEPYSALFNSRLVGFYIYHASSQWDTGEEKRDKIKNSDIEGIPVPVLTEKDSEKISAIVNKIEQESDIIRLYKLENQIDELIFDLYGLKEYEKEIIREFYQIRVERNGAKKLVNPSDIKSYIYKFSEIFNDMLSAGHRLKATYRISANIGAVVCFNIVENDNSPAFEEDKTLEILHFVKKKQLQKSDISKILNEDKVKIYDGNFMYIIKSNLFKDWTIRQAIKDAKEEIGLLLSKLPDTHER